MMSDLVSAAGGLSLPVIAQVAAQADGASSGNPAIWWLVGAAAAAVIFNQLATAWDRLTTRFSRQQTPDGQQFQTAAGCKAVHSAFDSKVDSFCREIRDSIAALGREAEERSSKLHARIDPISQRVTAVDARVDDHLADHRSHRAGSGGA